MFTRLARLPKVNQIQRILGRQNVCASSLTFSPVKNFTIKKKSSKIWMNEHVNDEYVKKAKMFNYRSRAAFKLIEINHRYNVLKPGYKVLDLGCAPGGWTQIAVEKVNSTGSKPLVLSIDRDIMAQLPGSYFIQGDIEDEITRIKVKEFFNYENVDVVLSDMAPNFSGDRDMDHMEISVLNALTLKVCFHNLRTGGSLLMKSLNGAVEKSFFNFYKNFFKNFQRIKPSASRSRSSEIFYLGTGFKLNENYQKLLKAQEQIKQGKPFTPEDMEKSGVDVQGLKDFFVQLLGKCDELGIPITNEVQVELDKLGITYESDPSKKNRLKDVEFRDIVTEAYEKENKLKFSFVKKVPNNLKEMFEMQKESDKEFDKMMGLNGEEKDDGLFMSDDDDKDVDFEKMDSLADIDAIPEHLFEEETKESSHLKQMREEQMAYIKSFEKEFDFEKNYQTFRKENAGLEELLEKNPEEFKARYMKDLQNEEFNEELDEVSKFFTFYEGRMEKDKAKIIRQNRKETKDYQQGSMKTDDFWNKN